MIVNIYDVGHGFCGYIRDQVTGANLLIDCGYNEVTGVHPAERVLAEYGPIGGLAIQNYDEDHVDGLVSHTARTSSRDALLARVVFLYSWRDKLPFVVFEIAALLTSRSSWPNSWRICSVAAAIERRSVTPSWIGMAPDPISVAAAAPRSKLRDPTSTVRPVAASSFAT
jgi:hypothetical protein